MDWSALPLDVFLNIASFQSFNFLFLLAISGVCSTWRSHSAWIQRLAVFWPPLDDFKGPRWHLRVCGRHKVDLHQCSCFHDSISMVISRLHKVCFVNFNSLEFLDSLLETEKLRDSDWEKLSGSLLYLNLRAGRISSRVLGFITQCKSLVELQFDLNGSSASLEEFLNVAAAAKQHHSLENVVSLSVDFKPWSIGPLHTFLALFTSLRKIQLNSHAGMAEQVKLEVPDSLHDYDLTLRCSTGLLLLSAKRARTLEIGGARFVILDSAEWLEELTLSPAYVLFAHPERMESFWRLRLTGSFWKMHEAMSACDSAPTTKRLCLGDDFNLLGNESDKPECFSLFSEMFRGARIEELELGYSFLCRMWLDEKQEGLHNMMSRLPSIGFLVLDLEVGAEEKLDVSRLADVVELLVKCCRMEWISLSFTNNIEEDVSFHPKCFDKISFSVVVHNIIYYGCPER